MAMRATPEVTANDAVALLVEVAALVLLGVWGYTAGTDSLDRLLLAVGVPSAAIVLWALFAAPKAVHDGPGARLTVKVVVLGGAVLAGFAVLPLGWAVVFAVVVVVNTLLIHVGPYARRPAPAGADRSTLEGRRDAPL